MDTKDFRGLMEAYSEVYAPQEEIEEATYSAKAARAGKDIGKPGKAFAKIADSAGKRYGSKERGEKVAGAVLAKLRREEIEVVDEGKSSRPRYSGPERVGLGPEGSERRTEKREAHAENRKGHTEGPGTVTKNPKKLRKQKSMGELGGSGKAEVEEQLDIFDVVLEFLQVEGYAETLEEAEWLMANELDTEDINSILDEALTGERYKKVMKKSGGTAYSRKVSADPSKRATRGGKGGESDFGAGDRGSGNKAARRAGTYQEYNVNEAQHARENPEKYEREQAKKSAPVRGERTPMPPRGDKRREDFEKWYAKQH